MNRFMRGVREDERTVCVALHPRLRRGRDRRVYGQEPLRGQGLAVPYPEEAPGLYEKGRDRHMKWNEAVFLALGEIDDDLIPADELKPAEKCPARR